MIDTAWYEFDMRKIRNRIAYLRSLLGEDIALAYAVKANTFIIEDMIPWVERFEICSPGESYICDELGVAPEQTVISGVYKTPSFVEECVAKTEGRTYTVESMTQFHLLRGLSEKYQKKLTLLLRLTNDSQFGINESEIREIIAKREAYPWLDFLGIQFFSGTQKTSLKKLARELRTLDALFLALKEEYGYEARELEYGPGFPVAYYEGEQIDEEALIGGFAELLKELVSKPHITLELGRAIAACCGRYFTHIVDKKTNKGQNYLLVDGGMHHIVYFGQYMGMKHPVLSVVGKENNPIAESWNICGSLCSMNDILAKQVPLPEINIGDTLCFENTGAYCMTEGISLFLTREIPAVYLIRGDGRKECVRKPFETAALNTPKL
ncbi:MAG: diaminopimelate decarboxylase [Oscillospiraceae bacterium]|nr:diaminopimelate decarboxylase [Oscillospiraceae bacterium]